MESDWNVCRRGYRSTSTIPRQTTPSAGEFEAAMEAGESDLVRELLVRSGDVALVHQ